MKKALIIISLMLFLVPGFVNATPWEVDDSIKVVQWVPSVISGVGNTSGGLAKMDNSTNNETIYTFCLELNEYTSQQMYVADINDDIAYKGGRYTDSTGSTVPNDPLSGATKWLYYQFLTGNITGDNIKALALAIWYLEDEYYDVKGNSLGDWKTWYKLQGGTGDIADTAIIYITDAQTNHAGYTNSQIRVLDTYYFDAYENKTLGQSFLIFVPEPASMLLLGLGLFGIGLVSRKKK